MKNRDTDSWTDYTDDTRSGGASNDRPVRRNDTDLSDIPPARQADGDRTGKRRRPKDTELSATADPDAEQQSQDQPTGKPVKKRTVPEMIMSVLSGNILSRSEVTRAYPYMIFISVLAFIYIANIFRTQSTYREHAALTEQVKELRAKSMTIASEKMKATRQSNIMTELSRRGIPLKESLTPNRVIPKRTANEKGQVDR